MSKPKLTFLTNNGQPYPAWSMSLLKDAVEINPKTESLPKQFIYIDLEAVQGGALTSTKVYEKTDAPSRAQRLLKANDVLFQMVRPYQKNNYFFELEGSLPTVSSTGYAQLRSTENNPKFIYYTLHTDEFVKNVSDRCTGGTYPAINSSDLGRIPINIPCKEEQQKIAAFLTTLDQKIELETNKLSKYRQAKKAIFQKILNDSLFEKCPLKTVKVYSVASAITGYPFDSDQFKECGIRLVKGANVKRGVLDFSPEITSFWADCNNIEKFLLQKGDLLIQMDGAQVGKSFGFVEQDLLPALLVQRVTRLRCDESVANILYQYLDHGYFYSYVKKRMTNTAVPHISLNDIKDFEFKVPEMEEYLKKMSNFFELLESKIKIIECRRDVFIRQKQSFMQQMFV